MKNNNSNIEYKYHRIIIKESKVSFIEDSTTERKDCGVSGFLFTTYDTICRCIGKPNSKGDSYKVDAEWIIDTPIGQVSIFNYKNGKNYLGNDGMEVNMIQQWSVAYNYEKAISYVIDILELHKAKYIFRPMEEQEESTKKNTKNSYNAW